MSRSPHLDVMSSQSLKFDFKFLVGGFMSVQTYSVIAILVATFAIAITLYMGVRIARKKYLGS